MTIDGYKLVKLLIMAHDCSYQTNYFYYIIETKYIKFTFGGDMRDKVKEILQRVTQKY